MSEARKYTIRVELEFLQGKDMDFTEVQDCGEYLLAPVLATLDSLGMTAQQVEIFDSENGNYAEILKEDIEVMNSCGEIADDEDEKPPNE